MEKCNLEILNNDFDLKLVKEKDQGQIILYAISTCPWCKKTKKLLNKMEVAYDYGTQSAAIQLWSLTTKNVSLDSKKMKLGRL